MRLESKFKILFLVAFSMSVLSCKPDDPDYFEDVAFDLAGETSKTWVMNAMPTGPCAPELLLPLNTITNLTLYRENQFGLYDDFNCITRVSWSVEDNKPGRSGRNIYLSLTIFDPVQQVTSPYQQRFLVTVNGGAISLTDESTGARYTGIASETPYDVNAICTNGVYDPAFENDKDCGGICPTVCGPQAKLVTAPNSMALLSGGQSIAFLDLEDGRIKVVEGANNTPTLLSEKEVLGFDVARSNSGGFLLTSDPGNFQIRNFQSNGAEGLPINLTSNTGLGLFAQETHIRVSNQGTAGFATYSGLELSTYNNANQIISSATLPGVFDITYLDNSTPFKVFVLAGDRYEIYDAFSLGTTPSTSQPIGGIIDADFGAELDNAGADYVYVVNNTSNQLVIIDEGTGTVVGNFDLSSYGTGPSLVSVKEDVIAVYFSLDNRVVFFDHNSANLPWTLTVIKKWNF
jgi:hypothetical protein